jgi:hypothetical protein
MSSVGYRLYGWEVMTSVLIHEFGHCDQFNEGKSEPAEWDAKVAFEIEANERGIATMPPDLVPENYRKHREFFLKTYLNHGWTPEKIISEWQVFDR